MKALQDSWSGEVAHHIGHGVSVSKVESGYAVNLPCEVCSQSFEYRISKRYPPEIIRKKLRNSQWRVDNHLVCPHCVKTRPNGLGKRGRLLQATSLRTTTAPSTEEAVRAVQQASLPALEILPPAGEPMQKLSSLKDLSTLLAPTSATPAAKPAALPLKAEEVAAPPHPESVPEVTPQGHRKTMALLEEYFDDSARRYRADKLGNLYNDARIAQEAAVPLAHVEDQRRRYFGELGVPPEVEKLSVELAEVRGAIAAIKAEAEAHAERILRDAGVKADTIRAAAVAAIEDLDVKVGVLDSEFKAVMARYGG